MNQKNLFLLESDDDPHLVARLVGLIVRKGGRVQTLSCLPAGVGGMTIELEVLGGRPAFLQAQLRNTAGVKRVDLAHEGHEMEQTNFIGG